jgi:hypothetical protein
VFGYEREKKARYPLLTGTGESRLLAQSLIWKPHIGKDEGQKPGVTVTIDANTW